MNSIQTGSEGVDFQDEFIHIYIIVIKYIYIMHHFHIEDFNLYWDYYLLPNV